MGTVVGPDAGAYGADGADGYDGGPVGVLVQPDGSSDGPSGYDGGPIGLVVNPDAATGADGGATPDLKSAKPFLWLKQLPSSPNVDMVKRPLAPGPPVIP